MISAIIILCMSGSECKPPVQGHVNAAACRAHAVEFAIPDPTIGTTRQGRITFNCDRRR